MATNASYVVGRKNACPGEVALNLSDLSIVFVFFLSLR